jgi:hypothetical protein
MWWSILLRVIAGLVLIYLVLLGLLWQAHRRHPETIAARDTLRLLPDLVRLFRRLAADPDLPRGVRIHLMLLLAYLISPLDLIPTSSPSSATPTMSSSSPSRCDRLPVKPDQTPSNDIGQAHLKACKPCATSLASDVTREKATILKRARMPQSGKVRASSGRPLDQDVRVTCGERLVRRVHAGPEVSRKRPAVEGGVHLVHREDPPLAARMVKFVPPYRSKRRTQRPPSVGDSP